jgi:hypothetical protein
MLIIDEFLKLCKLATQELSYFLNQMTQCNFFYKNDGALMIVILVL